MSSNKRMCRSSADNMSPREQLLKFLDQGSDVILTFTCADGTVEEVPAHSQTLQQWSEVLAAALGTERSSSYSSTASATTIKVPMDGTNKEDWLLAMEFVYPLVPPAEATWDNLEVLLQMGDKYGMPGLMHKVCTTAKYCELTLEPGKLFLWKWIQTLDAFGVTAAAKQCIDSHKPVRALVDACPPDILASLRSETLQHLVKVMKPWVVDRKSGYCLRCKAVAPWKPWESGSVGRLPVCQRCGIVIRCPDDGS